MNLISGRNVHEILPRALDLLFQRGVSRDTRNGPVLQLPGPTIICYEQSWERVMFWPERDANPFFHLMESMWMLAGRNDVEFVAQYAGRMKEYSDDGVTLSGAYGNRWRNKFGFDQLRPIAVKLKLNPNCRRQVLEMWDGRSDLMFQDSKDLPCNTHAYLARDAEGRLDITVCNRSNDLVWGCLGANAVHFSFLLEYMAGLIGCPVGKYYQFTNNLHGYLKTIEPLRELTGYQGLASPYELSQVKPFQIDTGDDFEKDLARLGMGYPGKSRFFRTVVCPMMRAHDIYKTSGPAEASMACDRMIVSDWQRAAKEWLERRVERRRKEAV